MREDAEEPFVVRNSRKARRVSTCTRGNWNQETKAKNNLSLQVYAVAVRGLSADSNLL